jgi:hypothetical protein
VDGTQYMSKVTAPPVSCRFSNISTAPLAVFKVATGVLGPKAEPLTKVGFAMYMYPFIPVASKNKSSKSPISASVIVTVQVPVSPGAVVTTLVEVEITGGEFTLIVIVQVANLSP